MLFDLEDEAAAAAKVEPAAAGVATPAASPAWVDQLFNSPVLAEQKKLGGRAVPQDEIIRKMLGALAEQGGKLTSAALARRMGLPAFSLGKPVGGDPARGQCRRVSHPDQGRIVRHHRVEPRIALPPV